MIFYISYTGIKPMSIILHATEHQINGK